MPPSPNNLLSECRQLLIDSEFKALREVDTSAYESGNRLLLRWIGYYSGYAFYAGGEYSVAQAIFQDTLGLCDREDDAWLIGLLHLRLAECANSTQNYDEAIEHSDNAASIFQRIDDEIGVCRSLFIKGTALLITNRIEESLDVFAETVSIAQQHDSMTALRTFINLGSLYDIKMQTNAAVEVLAKAIVLLETCEADNNNKSRIATNGYAIATHTGYERTAYNLQKLNVNIYGAMSAVLSNAGVYDESLRYAAIGLETVRKSATPLQLAMWCNNMVVIELELNNYNDAQVLLDEAESLLQGQQQIELRGYIALNRGRCAAMRSDTEAALQYLVSALDVFKQTHNIDETLTAMYHISKAYTARQEYSRAKQILEEAIGIAEQNNLLHLHSNVLVEYGRTKSLLQENDASAVVREAIRISEQHGRKRNYVEALSVLASVYENDGTIHESFSILKQYIAAHQDLLSLEMASRAQILTTLYGVESMRYKQIALEKQAELDKQSLLHLQTQLTMNNQSILIQMNELNTFRKEVLSITKQLDRAENIVRKVKTKLRESPVMQDTWGSYLETFTKVHPDFQATLLAAYPDLTAMEMKVCILIRAGLQTEEISQILSLSARTIENHRFNLRKKLRVGERENLAKFLMNI